MTVRPDMKERSEKQKANPPPKSKPRTWEQVLKVFWSHVEKTDTCWLWRGNVLDIRNPKKHYGSIEWNGKRLFTHRLAWQITYGEIPPGLQVLHDCDTPRCVNPFHLFLGTHKENLEDCTAKGRRSRLVGDRHPMVELTEAQAREIRRMAQTQTCAEITKTIGAPYNVVLDVMSGKTWKHLILMDINDITKWKKTDIKCPACSRLLWLMQLDNGMGKIFWCGTGPCPSYAANNGAPSIELLRKNVEEEPEYHESGDWL